MFTLQTEIIKETNDSTVSLLLSTLGKPLCYIIEDGYRKVKQFGQTRIPEGRYLIQKRYHGKFYQQYKRKFNHTHVFQLMDVPNYTDILIHIGNTNIDTDGCLLTNTSYKFDKTDYVGVGSQVAYFSVYKHLTNLCNWGDVFINVVR
jgi:hypothetical protein